MKNPGTKKGRNQECLICRFYKKREIFVLSDFRCFYNHLYKRASKISLERIFEALFFRSKKKTPECLPVFLIKLVGLCGFEP